MTQQEMRAQITADGRQKFVRELVEGTGYSVDEAVEYVYDMQALTKEQFVAKYFK